MEESALPLLLLELPPGRHASKQTDNTACLVDVKAIYRELSQRSIFNFITIASSVPSHPD